MALNFTRTSKECWMHDAEMLLCLLVLVFSFAAKLSWYQPKGVEMRGLTSSKMWQYELKSVTAIMATPDNAGLSSIPTTTVVSAILLYIAVMRWKLYLPASGEWLEREIVSAIHHARFARISQLRAPPVR